MVSQRVFFQKIAIFFIGLAALLMVSAASAAPLKAVVTVGMVADVVRAVGGDDVDVTTLMGSGVDPHSYRQTRSDVSLLSRADVIFASGLHLEAQLDELLHKLGTRKQVVMVADRLDKASLIEAEGFSGRYDPHVWMDPSLWADTINIVRDALIKAAPEKENDFIKNANSYEMIIRDLNSKVEATLKSVPAEKRVLITAHDAFGYFGRAFDVDVIGIQGLSTESEAGLQRIETMVSLLVERNINAVFVESSVSKQNVKALIEGAQARGHHVSIGGTLFSDAMGKEGTFEGTYIGMIDHNATTIARGLEGNALAKGVTGQLSPHS